MKKIDPTHGGKIDITEVKKPPGAIKETKRDLTYLQQMPLHDACYQLITDGYNLAQITRELIILFPSIPKTTITKTVAKVYNSFETIAEKKVVFYRNLYREMLMGLFRDAKIRGHLGVANDVMSNLIKMDRVAEPEDTSTIVAKITYTRDPIKKVE